MGERIISKSQYDFLNDFIRLCKENKANDSVAQFFGYDRIKTKLLEDHMIKTDYGFSMRYRRSSSREYLESLNWLKNYLYQYVGEQFLEVINNGYVSYKETAKQAIEEYERAQLQKPDDIVVAIEKMGDKITDSIGEKLTEAVSNVAKSIDNNSEIQKNHLENIYSELVTLNKKEQLKAGDLSKIANQITVLRRIVENKIESDNKYNEIREKAEKTVRRKERIHNFHIFILLGIAIISGIYIVFNYKGLEHPIAWTFLFTVLPTFIDVGLTLLKSVFVRSVDFYIAKYSKQAPQVKKENESSR